MARFCLHTLSQTPNLSTCGPGEEQECLRFSKQLAVLIYLAFRPQARATREELIGLLWENSSPHDARQALRQVVYQIRHGTNRELLEGDEVLVLRKSEIEFDVDIFRSCLAAGELQEASQVYETDFLSNVALTGAREFEHWTEGIRQQLAAEWRQLLRSLIAQAADAGKWADAARYAEGLIERDPYDIDQRLKMVELLALSGDEIRARAAADEARRAAMEIHGERLPRVLDEALSRSLQPAAAPERRRRGGFPRHPELVGRASDFRVVVDGWNRALGGEGGGVLIYGEAGIGKTRLALDLERRFQRDRCLVMRSACYAIEQSDPYGPFLELLREAHAAPGLSAAAPASLEVLAALVPEIASRFKATIAPRPEPIPRQALTASLLDAFLAIADELPLALIVEDLHLATPATIEFVHRLARGAHSTCLLVLVTARDVAGGAEISRALRELTTTGAVQQVALSPLDPADIRHFIGSIAMLPADEAGTSLAQQVFERTAGVPLYVLEFLKSLYDTGELQVEEGGWVFSDALRNPDRPLPLPQSGQGILERRLEKLGETPLLVFAGLAVWGREVTVQDLGFVTGLDEKSVSGALDALQRRRLVGGTPAMPAIRNEELAAVALRAVPDGVVRQFHIRATELAEQAAVGGRTAEWSVAARHAGAAGDASRAAVNGARAAAAVERTRGQESALETLRTIVQATPEPIRDEVEAALNRVLAKKRSPRSWLKARARGERLAQ